MNKLSALSWQIKAERAESELARVTAEREDFRTKLISAASEVHELWEENARLRGELELLKATRGEIK